MLVAATALALAASGARASQEMGNDFQDREKLAETLNEDDELALVPAKEDLAEAEAIVETAGESLAEALSTGDLGQPGGLHEQGLTCAGCHLRDYRWYGPARPCTPSSRSTTPTT